MPVLADGSAEVELVAGELNSWATVAVREKVLLLMLQVGAGARKALGRVWARSFVCVCGGRRARGG